MAEFQPRTQAPVGEKRTTHPGAERDDHFNAMALDGPIALHGGIVGDTSGFLPTLFEFELQRKADPAGMEIRGCIGGSMLDHAGKPDRYPIEISEQRTQGVERLKHRFRGWHLRGDYPLPL